jgi:hypothetical protein
MSAESGLKQRKVAAHANSDYRFNSSNTNDSDNSNNNNASEKENAEDSNNEEYDADSKETRLTLMEEILLLGLKDREVRFFS